MVIKKEKGFNILFSLIHNPDLIPGLIRCDILVKPFLPFRFTSQTVGEFGYGAYKWIFYSTLKVSPSHSSVLKGDAGKPWVL